MILHCIQNDKMWTKNGANKKRNDFMSFPFLFKTLRQAQSDRFVICEAIMECHPEPVEGAFDYRLLAERFEYPQ